MKGCVILKIEDIFVDENLLHLENVIYDLDRYTFPEDIEIILKNLQELVLEKMFSDLKFDDYEIERQDCIIRFHLKKN